MRKSLSPQLVILFCCIPTSIFFASLIWNMVWLYFTGMIWVLVVDRFYPVCIDFNFYVGVIGFVINFVHLWCLGYDFRPYPLNTVSNMLQSLHPICLYIHNSMNSNLFLSCPKFFYCACFVCFSDSTICLYILHQFWHFNGLYGDGFWACALLPLVLLYAAWLCSPRWLLNGSFGSFSCLVKDDNSHDTLLPETIRHYPPNFLSLTVQGSFYYCGTCASGVASHPSMTANRWLTTKLRVTHVGPSNAVNIGLAIIFALITSSGCFRAWIGVPTEVYTVCLILPWAILSGCISICFSIHIGDDGLCFSSLAIDLYALVRGTK